MVEDHVFSQNFYKKEREEKIEKKNEKLLKVSIIINCVNGLTFLESYVYITVSNYV
jgi:hypothetical protein